MNVQWETSGGGLGVSAWRLPAGRSLGRAGMAPGDGRGCVRQVQTEDLQPFAQLHCPHNSHLRSCATTHRLLWKVPELTLSERSVKVPCTVPGTWRPSLVTWWGWQARGPRKLEAKDRLRPGQVAVFPGRTFPLGARERVA